MIKWLGGILLHSGQLTEERINLRRWFIFYILYMSLLALTALAESNAQFRSGWHINLPFMRSSLSLQADGTLWLVALYLFYMSLCCTFFPAPTAWLVLLMASPVIGFDIVTTGNTYTDAILRIAAVATIGALGTAIANLNEYHIWVYLMRFGYVHKIRQTRLYTRALQWFGTSPFLLITVFSFLPVPVDVVRWLAISHYYNRFYYSLASFLGRLGRYGLLAAAATCLRLDTTAIIIIQLSFAAIIVLRWLIKRLYRYHTNPHRA